MLNICICTNVKTEFTYLLSQACLYFVIYVQTEMKLFGGLDTVALKQHFGKKIVELEEEKRTVQVNRSF